MADIKTHLRELSVATTVGLLKDNISFSTTDLYDSKKFFAFAKQVISGDISCAMNLCSTPTFSGNLKIIVDNGYNLGKAIFNNPYFKINKSDSIIWQGNDTQKDDPIDIKIGTYGFSLKEESFILENMGLYKLLNCYTGSAYKKRHIFNDYARTEYEAWFAATWTELLQKLSCNGGTWSYDNTVKKKKTGKTLVLRNECRFSHGQFNGTPEAKMYYEHGGSLEVIYETI